MRAKTSTFRRNNFGERLEQPKGTTPKKGKALCASMNVTSSKSQLLYPLQL